MPRALRGKGKSLALFDTSTGVVRPTAPAPTATMYVCGITPYDATHIGHANTYVAFDMINRAWRDAGHQVRYVQNVTDIDDPLLERAVATGDNWRAIADRETALFREDMAGLNVLPPDHFIGAVESIPSVASKVMQLQESGDVYAVDDDLYFRVRNDEHFGSIAGLREDDMVSVFAERGGRPQPARQGAPVGLPRVAKRTSRRTCLEYATGPRPTWMAHRMCCHRSRLSRSPPSISRVGARIWCSPITKWVRPKHTGSPASVRSLGTTCIRAWSPGRGTR